MYTKYFNPLIFALISLSCFSMISCEKGDERNKLDINHWIENTMRGDYLWSEEMPKSENLDYSADPQTFFRSLLSLKDGKTKNDSHYYYSYIEKNEGYVSTRTSIEAKDSYGLEFVRYTIVDEYLHQLPYEYIRVLYVLPNSPAYEKLKRGDWITQINNKQITKGDYKKLLNGGEITLTVGRKYPTTLTLPASRKVDNNPLYYHSVIETGDKKIGYLVYNHFTSGPTGWEDKSYDNQMKEIFRDFKNRQVNEFVLDLRYNGGGYLSCAQLLAGMFVPEKNKKDIFCITTDNRGKVNHDYFDETSIPLNLDRLFVIVSNSTASASEAVINGLTPYYNGNIILIGGRTEGKNVGSVHYVDNKYEWALQPITFKLTSKDIRFDYSNGLVPSYWLNELADLSQTDMHPLGNENEYMLAKAISLIINGNSIKNVDNRLSTPKLQIVGSSIDRNKTNGVIVTQEYMEKAFGKKSF